MTFVCWRCIESPVEIPGMECNRCYAHDDRAQRKRASSERSTQTHERTHELYRAELSDADIEDLSLRHWQDLTGQ